MKATKMARSPAEGFSVTSGRIHLVLGICALLGIAYQGISYAKDKEYAIDTNTKAIAEIQTQNKEVVAKLEQLNGLVGQLVAIAKGTPQTFTERVPVSPLINKD